MSFCIPSFIALFFHFGFSENGNPKKQQVFQKIIIICTYSLHFSAFLKLSASLCILTILNPIKTYNPTPSPNFEFPVFEAEEEEDEEIPEEIS